MIEMIPVFVLDARKYGKKSNKYHIQHVTKVELMAFVQTVKLNNL
jgi:hypothetical protein